MPHHTWNSGWNWTWMSLAMAASVVTIGVVVYLAVRLANRHDRDNTR